MTLSISNSLWQINIVIGADLSLGDAGLEKGRGNVRERKEGVENF